ncbi:MAG: D-sedoheptulose-7-phosphate isomerase [Nitrososphaerales archaeon]
MERRSFIEETIKESIAVKEAMAEKESAVILKISKLLTSVLQQGGTIYLCGNGGSAADAQHVAAEFVGRFGRERKALAAVALTTNTSTLTAIGNDYNFAEIFARQVQALVRKNDALVGISTSGKSLNVLNALREARTIGAVTVGFTGADAAAMVQYTDACLCVPSNKTPRIQEAHILAWHIICELVEQNLFQ